MSALQFNFREAETEDTILIELTGTIDTSRSVENLYNLILRSSATKLVISMAGVDYINSAGFAETIVMNQNAKKEGKHLVFSAMTPKVKTVFQSLGGMTLLDIVDTDEEALAKLV